MSRPETSSFNIAIEDDRTGTSVETLKRAITDNLLYVVGKTRKTATRIDYFMAVAYTVRDRIIAHWLNTVQSHLQQSGRVVAYLSAEYLLGPQLGNNLLNLNLEGPFRRATLELGLNLDDIISEEEEPGLGNGGLGRLAACYMDSLASLGIPSVGYGVRYEFGIFDQQITDGWQVEITDKWLRFGNPWELRRPQMAIPIGFGGRTRQWTDADGRFHVEWIPAFRVNGVPYDTPIPGFRTSTANNLRLWAAEAPESFHFDRFNTGDYQGAVAEKLHSENISKVLYPNDQQIAGKQLRLQQQYMFTSCSLQDMIRIHLAQGRKLENFADHWVVQLNDTHPAVSVAELMRLLIDVHGMEWDPAWAITKEVFCYTNHTLLPEALEKWPVPLFASVLPRHLEIIYEINQRFLEQVRAQYPGDSGKAARLSLIDEHDSRYVQMAHLACVGSRAINGVAALHTELLKKEVLHDFYELWPTKFVNVTNGVTPRRWIALANPELSRLLTTRLGERWLLNLEELHGIEASIDDAGFREEWRRIKKDSKNRLAAVIKDRTGIIADPSSMFDIQVKRIHEYKRQHLNVLYIASLYQQLKDSPGLDIPPRTFIFGGKAAPGYVMAKLMIKLINSVAEVVNNDPQVRDRIKVVFLPDYTVTLGQKVYPAAELSEQISTAGKEASGTGNMKFAMNGALTIGTLDGANIEIRAEAGEENFFLFGLSADEVKWTKAAGYRPMDYYQNNPQLRQVVDAIASGQFSRGDKSLFRPLIDSLLHRDDYMLFADYQSYVDCQHQVSETYRDQERWTKMSILNVARTGKFSSDRSIRDYCKSVWHVPAGSRT